MKEFQAFRTELNNSFEDLTEHVGVPTSSMPPNILILRRKTIRQFPDGVMVALYYNDKLGLQFSIPYGGREDSVVTPVALKEDTIEETAAWTRWQATKKVSLPQKQNWMSEFEKHVTAAKPEHTGKIDWDTAHYLHSKGHKPEAAATLYHTRRLDLKEEQLDELSKKTLRSYVVGAAKNKDLLALKASNMRQVGADEKSDVFQKKSWRRTKGIERAVGQMNEGHDPIKVLRDIKAGHAHAPIRHADGTQTKIDATTAHALLTVHDALKPEHQAKFSGMLAHSKGKLNKMVDFTWKNVA